MLRRRGFILLGAVLAAGAACAFPAIPAGASGLPPTRIVMSAAPGTVGAPGDQVTVSGTLETLVPAGQTGQPLPGEQVDLTQIWDGGTASAPLAPVTTDANGQFTETVTVSAPGLVEAGFAGDSSYGPGRGAAGTPAAAPLPMQITVDPGPAVPYGSAATITAHVTVQLPDGTWIPALGTRLEATGCNSGQSGWTDANGRYTTTIPATAVANCYFYTPGTGSWTGAGFSPRVIVPLSTFPTQIASFGPGYYINGGMNADNLQFAGFAKYTDSAGAVQDYPDANVQLYFQPLGAATWTLMSTVQASASGLFQFPVLSGYLPGGQLAIGSWKAVIPQSGAYLAASGVTGPVPLNLQTSFHGVHLRWSRHVAYLTGTLDYLPSGGPLHGVKVTVNGVDPYGKHFRAGTAVTNAQGVFSFRIGRAHVPKNVYDVTYPGGPLPAWAGPEASYTTCSPAYSKQFWV